METVTIKLDGAETTGLSGTTVLELAMEAGFEIPTLCYESGLSPNGACQVCVVEEVTTGDLIASCATPIKAGMNIRTRSPRVLERRKGIVQQMMQKHPNSCPECDENEACQLRRVAVDLGIERAKIERQAEPLIEDVSPFIQRDLSKCIRCEKCVRVDLELVAQGVKNLAPTGHAAKRGTRDSLRMDGSQCTYCGTCIAHCPVGALSERSRPGHAKADTFVDTTCAFCGCGCSVRLAVRDNAIISATPVETGPVNHGALCVRGSYGYEFVNSSERLTHPLMKTAGGFRRISWETALGKIACGLKKAIESHGASSVAVLGSPKCTNEENYVVQRLARDVLGTNNIDNSSSLYAIQSLVGLGRTVGFPGTTSSLNRVEKPSVIFLVGADPDAYAPAVGYSIRRAVLFRGARLIIVDPRKTRLSPLALLQLRPKVGTDVALLNAMARAIVDTGLFDHEFVDCSTENFQEMLRHLQGCNVADVSNVTGVPADDIKLGSHLLGTAEEVSIIFGEGICRQAAGADCVSALANLAMLTGNIGQPRGGLFALKQENNAQGACDLGSLPGYLPGYRSVLDEDARGVFERRWGKPIPKDPGFTATQMIDQALRGGLKAMLVFGENPIESLPNSNVTRKALESLELLVVADMFLSETAKLATIVLPAASFAEKEGTFTNFEGRIQPVRKAINSPGEGLSDFEIVLRLAERMEHKMPYSRSSQVMEEIRELVPAYAVPGDIDKEVETGLELAAKTTFSGTQRLYGGLFPTGFSRFCLVKYKPATQDAEDEYPFRLLTGTTLARIGSGARTSRSFRLKELSPGPWIEIGLGDAHDRGLSEGDDVRVTSPTGEIASVLKIVLGLPAGTLFMPTGFPETPVNRLFNFVTDNCGVPTSTGDCLVRLEKASNADTPSTSHETKGRTTKRGQAGPTSKGGQERLMVKEVPVIWLQTSTCTGCSVSLLESASPSVKNLLIDQIVPGTHISLRFHSTLMGGSGEQVLRVIEDTIANERGGYVLVVEGAIPTSPEGLFGFIGERHGRAVSMQERFLELAANSMAIMSVGTCAAFGGIPAAQPNPTGCKPAKSVLDAAGIAKPLINIPGCPPHPDWVVNTIAGILLRGLPRADELDDNLRPLAFYGKLIHETCPRRASFDEGKFAKKPGDEGCLYQLGCKGPITYADCPTRRWNSGTNWVIGAGAPCNGCTQPEFPDLTSPFYEKLPETLFRAPALIQR